MPADRIPKYRRHKQSGHAIVTLSDASGNRQDVLLGKWKSADSRKEYGRVIKEWEASGRCLPRSLAEAEQDITLNELLLLFWPHVESHYRHEDGTPTCEVDEYRQSFRPLRRLYGSTVAKEFGPPGGSLLSQAMRPGPLIPDPLPILNKGSRAFRPRCRRLMSPATSAEMPSGAKYAVATQDHAASAGQCVRPRCGGVVR